MYKADRILMFSKKNKISFKPLNEIAQVSIEPPSPSKMHIPDSYKVLPLKLDKNLEHITPDLKKSNFTVKACVPFLDAFTSGYMITLGSDVVATLSKEYNYRMYWDVEWEVITTHDERQFGDMTPPIGYERNPYKFENKWVMETPPGYSCLITHPLNRFDLPFFTMSAIVDTDQYNFLPVNLPFFLKEGFEGIIPKGTPIAQIIPFKREPWHSEKEDLNPLTKYQINNLKSVVQRSYKNRFWSKKTYE